MWRSFWDSLIECQADGWLRADIVPASREIFSFDDTAPQSDMGEQYGQDTKTLSGNGFHS
jgi:hypothetical protein